MRTTPAQRVTSTAAGQSGTTEPPRLSREEIDQLKETYDQASDDEKAAMVASFKDMGIDLLALFGISQPGQDGAIPGADEMEPQSLAMAVQMLDFTRTPKAVLEARAKIGLKSTAMPPADAPMTEQADWLHDHVMAGDWSAFEQFMHQRAGDEGEAVYAFILQSTNQGDPGLLPEEVLGISDAAPGDLTDWQLDVLAQLLKNAAARSSTGPAIAQIRNGTRLFGTQDDEHRNRTAKFLSMAGLHVEAYEFLPSIEDARKNGDVAAIIDHAQYHLARASNLGSRPEARQQLRQAWDLFCEVTLMDSADTQQRRDCLHNAVDLLASIPPEPARAWLETLLANPSLAPATLEAVALKAISIEDENISDQDRAQAILTMKEAVDTLLANAEVDIDALRVPLRMLTMSLVTAAEQTIAQNAALSGVAPETSMLFRALPGRQWRSVIEPSLAVRAYKAFMGIALAADDTDYALDLLDSAVRQNPGQAEELADEFLRVWIQRLNPAPDPRMNMGIFYYYGGMFRPPSAPLTRGRQRRNLDRLQRLLTMMSDIGIDGRRLDRLVEAFGACHGRSETYQRDALERILGPIRDLAPSVSSGIAEAMRIGLNGDWRNRDVQRDAGMKRTKSEVDLIVEQGYLLAQDLIDSALMNEPDSWKYALTRTALAYDFMQFKGQREQDAASYQSARAELFNSFRIAADAYRDALQRGEVRADPTIYLTWFGIALGSSNLAGLTVDDLLTEGAENEAQLDAIRSQILSMQPDQAQQHLGEFARGIMDVVGRLSPEVKAGVVRRAAYVVGDHPAGAPLRRMLALYDDLLKDEIRVRLTIDGPDRVGDQPFGVMMSLRYTASIDREIGGFDQYLRNNVYMALGGRYQTVNLRDRLEKAIQQAFSGDLELLSIGFFDPMNPTRSIMVDGKPGWEEKPIAYLVLKATDESTDHLPALQMDLNLQDSTGPVTLPVRSNTPLIDAVVSNESAGPRPLHKVEVRQTLDLRSLQNGEDDPVVKLEINANGFGVIPTLESLLSGIDKALPGYVLTDDNILADPMTVVGVQASQDRYFYGQDETEDNDTYVEAGDDGIFRLGTTRRWTLTYRPASGPRGKAFTLPVLADGIDGSLRSDCYREMDIVEVSTASIPITPGSNVTTVAVVGGLVLVAGLAGVFVLGRLRGQETDADVIDFVVPDRVTPVSAIVALQRIEQNYGYLLTSQDRHRLSDDINALEQAYFAQDNIPGNDVRELLQRWRTSLHQHH